MQNHQPLINTVSSHTFIPRFLNTRSTVVDLGGNLGNFSGEMHRRFGCDCYVVEPSPFLFNKIPKGPHLHVFNLAITDRSRPLTFYPAADITAGSLTAHEGTGTEQITVQGISLDEFLTQNNIKCVDLLKVDIEGAERELFASLSDANLKRIQQITIEFHDFMPDMMTVREVETIRERLSKAGFRCLSWKLFSNMDVLFVRRELMSLSEYLYTLYIIRPLSKVVTRLPYLRMLRSR